MEHLESGRARSGRAEDEPLDVQLALIDEAVLVKALGVPKAVRRAHRDRLGSSGLPRLPLPDPAYGYHAYRSEAQ